ncbi:MAPEG family protein [Congregibacter variabilis]|uniref:MAPEG family protein n=1 Tax=Congregibacter variabilis TaxID=3081200 RepID=A0ABZ0I1J6_9GAMM|nr:MAPEG family protein [Congregibacter sp. IMCC43200]
MNYVHIVAVLAISQFIYLAIMVGRARGKYSIDAPATTGHEMFDRAFRIQMNTLEQLVCFLPALLLADVYWPGTVIAAIGAVYIVGRVLYASSYTKDPATRALGFALSIMPTFTLLGAAGLGAVLAGVA